MHGHTVSATAEAASTLSQLEYWERRLAIDVADLEVDIAKARAFHLKWGCDECSVKGLAGLEAVRAEKREKLAEVEKALVAITHEVASATAYSQQLQRPPIAAPRAIVFRPVDPLASRPTAAPQQYLMPTKAQPPQQSYTITPSSAAAAAAAKRSPILMASPRKLYF